MKRAAFILVFFLSNIGSGFSYAGWQDDLNELMKPESKVEQEKLIRKVVKAKPDWPDVVSRIEATAFPIVETGKFYLKDIKCIDDDRRPYVLYVPHAYNPGTPTPLLVVLHGGVSRAEIIDSTMQYAREHPFSEAAKKHGWFVSFPFGQKGATWWDEVGMANIRNQVRVIKQGYNIDDDRVWMGGFSDGASASFLHAMVDPTDYGAFIALNGHMGVGSSSGDQPIYAPNFFNTPVYAITTDKDRLYPTSKMRPTIEMAVEARGKILYRELEGTHDWDYLETELPYIADFLKRHPRDPFPAEINWETAEKCFGKCRWFAIDEITINKPAQWHTEYNMALIDDRVSIGFLPDDTYEGKGVKVGSIVGDKNYASRVGLKAGDIIIKGNDTKVSSMDDLKKFKAGLKRGDYVELTVIRDENEIVLKGNLPESENYLLFKREKPSAKAIVSACANRIDIKTSRVGAFRIFIHPDMFRPEQNLVIEVNGVVVHDAPVEPDIEFMLRNFLENRDRRLIYIAEVEITP